MSDTYADKCKNISLAAEEHSLLTNLLVLRPALRRVPRAGTAPAHRFRPAASILNTATPVRLLLGREGQKGRGLRVLLVPFPAAGHLIGVLTASEWAGALVRSGGLGICLLVASARSKNLVL